MSEQHAEQFWDIVHQEKVEAASGAADRIRQASENVVLWSAVAAQLSVEVDYLYASESQRLRLDSQHKEATHALELITYELEQEYGLTTNQMYAAIDLCRKAIMLSGVHSD
jgi:hypothetical protein